MGIEIIPIVAAAILVLLVTGLLRGWFQRYWLWLFLIGCALGMVWEIGFTALSMGEPIAPGGAPREGVEDLDQAPVAVIAMVLIIVCIWDGGLFLAGLGLARVALQRPILRSFSWAELGILQLWGQLQSFVVEMYAIEYGFWAYSPTPANPALFAYREASITLWPQLVWLLAGFVFYAAALSLARRHAARSAAQ